MLAPGEAGWVLVLCPAITGSISQIRVLVLKTDETPLSLAGQLQTSLPSRSGPRHPGRPEAESLHAAVPSPR